MLNRDIICVKENVLILSKSRLQTCFESLLLGDGSPNIPGHKRIFSFASGIEERKYATSLIASMRHIRMQTWLCTRGSDVPEDSKVRNTCDENTLARRAV